MSLESAYTVPSVSPLYPPPPYRYRDCPLMVVPFVAEPGVTRRLVPEPLTPNPDDIAYVAIGHLHNDRLGSTREAFIVVPSSDGARRGNYSVVLYLENDACVTSGREIWGWPKKLAEISFAEDTDSVRAVVRRGGAEIVRAGIEGLQDASADELDLSPVWFNQKIIPSVIEGAPPEVSQLTATTFEGLEVVDVRRGRGALRLEGTDDDALAALIRVREVLPGHRLTLSFRLLHGEIVHDYLTGETGPAKAERGLVAAG
jgi:acetoacetate decarboxylase